MNTDKRRLGESKKSTYLRVYLPALLLILFSSACSQLEKSKPAPFYAETAPPQVKEFRWSNGRLPKSFDPAKAAAPPETDAVRAVYEGLTDTNAKTLETIPSIAVDWSASDDYRTWTFKLRRDARWSNGERVTAQDFARSWQRLVALGDKVPHFQLLGNIAGIQPRAVADAPKSQAELDFFENKNLNQNLQTILKSANDGAQKTKDKQPGDAILPDAEKNRTAAETKIEQKAEQKTGQKSEQKPEPPLEQKLGVEAVDDYTLKVSLLKPDRDFPALVAHPLFRPIYGDGKYFEAGKLNADIVTNGAFRPANVSPEGVTLERSESFWNKSRVEIERVRFVPMESAEAALEAYRAGELDAVTNIDFEPLALKLLTPFDDFRRTAHGALNFYEFNTTKAPYDDRRVREALSISIERERLTEDEMDGASVPAFGFSPFENGKNTKLKQDAARAETLLAEAGFAGGENFPVVRLVVNRNNVQQRIARAVAKMWKRNLNVETEIVVKDQDDFGTARQTKDYDLLRRGVVLPTTDEAMNMLAIFEPQIQTEKLADAKENIRANENKTAGEDKTTGAANQPDEAPIAADANADAPRQPNENQAAPANKNTDVPSEISSENEAAFQIRAVPLYFATSYSLVKPYIQGFEINTLDAPSLQNVRIDNNWQPKKAEDES